MGDFIIDLVNSDAKPEVYEFFDNFFALYILQPRRFLKKCKPLIDNILVNAIEFGSYSGNPTS